MAWLIVKGVLINLDYVKHFEKTEKNRYVIVHFLGDPNPLMIPFSSPEEAEKWFNSLNLVLSKELNAKVVNGNLATAKFN